MAQVAANNGGIHSRTNDCQVRLLLTNFLSLFSGAALIASRMVRNCPDPSCATTASTRVPNNTLLLPFKAA
ncbi:hypothetical protein DM860_007167 [Cuscuta australis]|uniref:Uncharacterized protein n=1 Tax=Cuscuta australis TaxID=267555 RepID=A0A328E649_9ASTE|nr:hypothetical protein DM860_007167 [Cuscuta australis]